MLSYLLTILAESVRCCLVGLAVGVPCVPAAMAVLRPVLRALHCVHRPGLAPLPFRSPTVCPPAKTHSSGHARHI